MASEIVRPVAQVKQDAWFLRFYLWLWEAEVEKVDFCRLFWGYIFAIPALLLRLIITPIYWTCRAIIWFVPWAGRKIWGFLIWLADRIAAGFEKILPPERERLAPMLPGPTHYKKKKRQQQPSPILNKIRNWKKHAGVNFLKVVGTIADKGVGFAQTAWPYFRWFLVGVGILFAIMIGLLTGYLLYFLITAFPTAMEATWTAISWTGGGIAFLASGTWNWPYLWLIPTIIFGVIAFIVFLMVLANTKPAKRGAGAVGGGVLSFGGAMKTGYHGVKYRTCPVIKVVK